MERLLKSVTKNTWASFKAESAMHNMRMGEFLGSLVNEHIETEKKRSGWDFVLDKKASISEKESRDLKEIISAFEKEMGFE